MPFILVVLFVLALLVTCAGLFLSPISQTRETRTGYQVVTKKPHVPDAALPRLPEERTRAHVMAAVAPERRRMLDSTTLPKQELQRMMANSTALPAIPLRASRSASADTTTGRVAAVNVSRGMPIARPGRDWGGMPGRDLFGDWRDRLTSWKVLLPGVCTLFLLAFYLFSTLLPHPAVWTSVWFGANSVPLTPTVQAAPVTTTYTASHDLVRLGQLDTAQYNSMQEYNTWAYSACSAASMTEVINSYGHKYRITDILTVESRIHEITPDEGLLEESGIAHTGSLFGFKTTWGHSLTLAQVIAKANSGTPVIVSWPPYLWAGGHILVVRGGDSNNITLADSSRLDMVQMTHERFMQLWGGFSAIMTPA